MFFLGLGAADGGFVREASIVNMTSGSNRVAQVLAPKGGGITYLPQGVSTPPPQPQTHDCWDGSRIPINQYCPPEPPPLPPTQQPSPPYVPPPTPSPSAVMPAETQSPTPGMIITTTAATTMPNIFAAMPKWGWGLGLLAVAGGTYALWKRSRR